jgi:hypothetical protein
MNHRFGPSVIERAGFSLFIVNKSAIRELSRRHNQLDAAPGYLLKDV